LILRNTGVPIPGIRYSILDTHSLNHIETRLMSMCPLVTNYL
jgi:hypothetical protein